MISVVIPALNEEASLAETIRSCRRAGTCEVVVADGGSRDKTVEIARRLADAVVAAPMGRATQMNAGAAASRGDTLLFLHADTALPPGGLASIAEAMADGEVVGGAFRIRLTPSAAAGPYARAVLRAVGRGIGFRSRLSRSYTGDQAMFVRADAFRAFGGFPEIPLMEDVEMSRRMRRAGKTVLLPEAVGSSGRRWEAWGPARTVFLMWGLRIGYLLGMSPERCAARYRKGPSFLQPRASRRR
ncbi:MAG: TIGR04283 family arsenosugar biosynthesis glycosyltransferase [Thermodesulfobacteriota bacterium]